MGLACAVVFAVHLVLLNRLTRNDSPWRMAAGQFLWVALSMGVLALFTAPSRSQMDFAGFARFEVWGNLLLLVLVPTVFSFGVMFLYQPQVDPTRAAMIYLLEPVFASLIAWILVGRGLDAVGLAGASMILIANGLAELRTARSRQ
jgi:drug/metabolite transporter (DMT)-like permease